MPIVNNLDGIEPKNKIETTNYKNINWMPNY